MWAGSRIEFLAPIAVDAALTRVTTIEAIKPKRGASGDLLFVTLRHDIAANRSEEHTSELQSLMRTSYAVFCLKKKKQQSITPKILRKTTQSITNQQEAN